MVSSQNKKRITLKTNKTKKANQTTGGSMTRASQSASEAGTVAMKLLRSTGKAAWIAGTTFLVLVVPLIIQMDREQQYNELELQQASLLGSPAASTH